MINVIRIKIILTFDFNDTVEDLSSF